MTDSQIHEKRKVKNYLIFGLLFLVVISIFSITIVKLDQAAQTAIKDPKNINQQQ